MKIEYTFSAIPWQHSGPGGWFFVALPISLAAEIRQSFQSEEEGWGRLKVVAKIGRTKWETAIWFDTKSGTYLLPLKVEARKKEKVKEGQGVEVTLYI